MALKSTPTLKREEIKKNWFVVDANGIVLGKLASKVAHILRGKHKASYSPHADDGDYVVVIHAEKIHLSGKKWEQKKYRHHSGYVGHLKEVSYKKLREKNPILMVKQAVKGMLPKNRLGRAQLRHLKVYAGANHKHDTQNPTPLEIK